MATNNLAPISLEQFDVCYDDLRNRYQIEASQVEDEPFKENKHAEVNEE